MKHFVLIALAFLLCLSASAQIEKGTVLISAGSNFNYTNYMPTSGSSTGTTNLDLKAGYFLAENFTLGLNFGYVGSTGSSATTIGAFGRYYPGGKFFVGAGYNSVAYGSGGTTTSKGQLSLEGGYAAFINKFLAVEPALNYASGDGYSQIGVAVAFSIYLNRGE
jgi:hypothetical protein